MDWQAHAVGILKEGLECFHHRYYRSAFEAAYTAVAVLCDKQHQKGQITRDERPIFHFQAGVNEICRADRFSQRLSHLKDGLDGMQLRRKSIVHLDYENPTPTETITHLTTAFLFAQNVDVVLPSDVVGAFRCALEASRGAESDSHQTFTTDWRAHAIGILAEGLECFQLGYCRSAFQAAYTTVAVLCDQVHHKGQSPWKDGRWLHRNDPEYQVVERRFRFEAGVWDISADSTLGDLVKPLEDTLLAMHARRDNIVHRQYETPTRTETLDYLKTAVVFAEAVKIVLPDDLLNSFREVIKAVQPAHADPGIVDPVTGASLRIQEYWTTELGIRAMLPFDPPQISEGPHYSKFTWGNAEIRVEVLEVEPGKSASAPDDLILSRINTPGVSNLVVHANLVKDLHGLQCHVAAYSRTVGGAAHHGRILCTPVMHSRWIYFADCYSLPASFVAYEKLFDACIERLTLNATGPHGTHALVVQELVKKFYTYPNAEHPDWETEWSITGVQGNGRESLPSAPEIVVRRRRQTRYGPEINVVCLAYVLRDSSSAAWRARIALGSLREIRMYVPHNLIDVILKITEARRNVSVYERTFSAEEGLCVRRLQPEQEEKNAR